MQKDINNFETEPNHSSNQTINSSKTFDLTKPQNSCQFIGYKPLQKGRIFRSKAEKYYPWRFDAPSSKWIEQSEIDQKTRELRELFSKFVKVSLNYVHYQFETVSIPYFDQKGKKQNYQPLGLLTYWESVMPPRKRKCLLFDVWSDSKIKENADWLIPAFRVANYFAIRRKLKFKVFRDKFFAPELFSNILFIEPYMEMVAEDEDVNLIFQIMESQPCTPLVELKQIFTRLDPNRINELIATVWYMVGKRFIKIDWNKKFDEGSLLQLNFG